MLREDFFMDTKAVRNIVTATALSYGVLLIRMLVSGIFLPSMADPDEAIKLIGSAMFFGGAFLAGLASSKLNSSFLSSLFSGALYLLVIFVIGLFFKGDKSASAQIMYNIIALAFSLLGGFAASFKRKKRLTPKKIRDKARRRVQR